MAGATKPRRLSSGKRAPATGLAAATLQALHQVAIASGTRDVRAVAEISVDHARRLLAADAAVVFSFEQSSGLLVPIYETTSTVNEPPVVPGEGAIGKAFLNGVPIIVENYQTWQHSIPTSMKRGMVSAVAVPLMLEDRSIGALGI